MNAVRHFSAFVVLCATVAPGTGFGATRMRPTFRVAETAGEDALIRTPVQNRARMGTPVESSFVSIIKSSNAQLRGCFATQPGAVSSQRPIQLSLALKIRPNGTLDSYSFAEKAPVASRQGCLEKVVVALQFPAHGGDMGSLSMRYAVRFVR